MIVRRASSDDLPALRGLLENYFASIPPECDTQDAAAAAAFYTHEPACSWLAFVDGKPAGCAALRPLAERSSELKHVYVDPACRGRHIGQALLQAVHAYARAAAREKIYLDSLPSMQAARRLYEQMGYADTERYCREDDVHRVFMKLDLR